MNVPAHVPAKTKAPNGKAKRILSLKLENLERQGIDFRSTDQGFELAFDCTPLDVKPLDLQLRQLSYSEPERELIIGHMLDIADMVAMCKMLNDAADK